MDTNSQGRWVLAATILASSMAFIDGTVVNVALPFLQTDFNATAIGIQWVVEAYALFLSALLLVGGSLGDRYGRRRIFNIGVVLFAIASALFALPTVSPTYWTSFFPAVLVLGLGMSISVAPLTTTVMSAVGEEQAGVASGINNAVSRTAGLLAIAVFGVVMLHAFGQTLATRMNEIQLDDQLKHSLYDQRVKLAGLEVPPTADSGTREKSKWRSPILSFLASA